MTTETELHPTTLKAIRDEIGVTQAKMAELMGVPIRTYEDLEGGRSNVRHVHLNAAHFGALLHYARTEGAKPPRTALAVAGEAMKRYWNK